VTSICGGGVVLGLGKEVGHDGEEESERGGEEQADAGVEDGADVGQAAEEVEVEEEHGEDEHDHRGGHHGGFIPVVGVGGGEVVHIKLHCFIALFASWIEVVFYHLVS
jgi:hypothetical protein